MIIRITTLTAYRNLTTSPLFEKKLWLLPLSEIYKGKEIIVYISIPNITFPKTSTNNALFQGFHNQNARLSNKVRVDYIRAIITTTP